PAVMASLRVACDFLGAFVAGHGYLEDRLGEIELCLEEIIVNIINYAYPEGPGTVEISLREGTEGELEMEVVDRGVAFDPLSVDDPDISKDIDERRIGGLGIFFVKQLADRVVYRREGDRNILSLTFVPHRSS
ncbi:MAG: ATP-binding protein, partial [Syntrophales bacterium]|nr:ATP-binding protein [Syntrophales bacterium]